MVEHNSPEAVLLDFSLFPSLVLVHLPYPDDLLQLILRRAIANALNFPLELLLDLVDSNLHFSHVPLELLKYLLGPADPELVESEAEVLLDECGVDVGVLEDRERAALLNEKVHNFNIFEMLVLKISFSKFRQLFNHAMQPHLFYKSIETLYDSREYFTSSDRRLCAEQIKSIPKALANLNDINMIIDIHRKLEILQLNSQLTEEIMCQKALAIHNRHPKLASLKFLTRNFSALLDSSLLIERMMVDLMRTIEMPVNNNSYKETLQAMSLIKEISDSKNQKVLKEIQQLILRNQLNYLKDSSFLLSEIALNLQICESVLYDKLFKHFMERQAYQYEQYHRILAVVNEQQDLIYQSNTWAEITNLYVRANQQQRKQLMSVIDRKCESTAIPISSCLILLQSVKHEFQKPLLMRILEEYSYLDANSHYFLTSYYVKRLQKANSCLKEVKISRQAQSKLIRLLKEMRGLWKVQDQMNQIERNQ